jgi:hypothetical protein
MRHPTRRGARSVLAAVVAGLGLTAFYIAPSVAATAHTSSAGPAGLSAPEANAPVLKSVGKGEGHLNLIAWEG